MARIYVIGLLLVSIALPACGVVYTGEKIDGRVIDKDTGQPLSGVIVAVHWQLRRGGLDGSLPAGTLLAMETVAGPQGQFSFPPWGPRVSLTARLESSEPRLIFYKRGYLPAQLTNAYSAGKSDESIRKSEWSGRIVSLAKAGPDEEARIQQLVVLDQSLEFAKGTGNDCLWKSVPRMLAAMEKERLELASRKHPWAYRIRAVNGIEPSAACGDTTSFFAEYMK